MVIRGLRLLILLAFLTACPSHQGWAAIYEINGDLIGETDYYVLKKNETLAEIARRYDVGLVELLAANPKVQRKKPQPGTVLTITTQHILPPSRQGLVLNLSELRLFYYLNATQVMTAPISIGKEGWETPLGITQIVQKRENPEWIPTDTIRRESPHLPAVVAAGPDNPLGLYALHLGWPSYAIHGTNRPYSVGKRASHGCIRLYPEDIEALFKVVDVGTTVTVIDATYKLGWQGEHLFLEVVPTQHQADALIEHRQQSVVNAEEIYAAIKPIARRANINWQAVDKVVLNRSGIPELIGVRSPPHTKPYKVR